MSLDDRIGAWFARLVGGILFRLLPQLQYPADPDPLEEVPYRITAPKGVSLGHLPDTVEKGTVVWLQRDIGDILVREGSVEHAEVAEYDDG